MAALLDLVRGAVDGASGTDAGPTDPGGNGPGDELKKLAQQYGRPTQARGISVASETTDPGAELKKLAQRYGQPADAGGTPAQHAAVTRYEAKYGRAPSVVAQEPSIPGKPEATVTIGRPLQGVGQIARALASSPEGASTLDRIINQVPDDRVENRFAGLDKNAIAARLAILSAEPETGEKPYESEPPNEGSLGEAVAQGLSKEFAQKPGVVRRAARGVGEMATHPLSTAAEIAAQGGEDIGTLADAVTGHVDNPRELGSAMMRTAALALPGTALPVADAAVAARMAKAAEAAAAAGESTTPALVAGAAARAAAHAGVGAAAGTAFSPDDRAVGALLGGVAGAAHSLAEPPWVGRSTEGANLAGTPERLLANPNPVEPAATARVASPSPAAPQEADFEVEQNDPGEALKELAQKYGTKPAQPTPLEQLRGAVKTVESAKSTVDQSRATGERRSLERAAHTDALTGLGNQRALDATLPPAEADPNTEVLSIDLNGLKALNDAHGHAAGDAAIQAAAAAIRAAAPDAPAFHPHGDEFVATVPKGTARPLGDAIEQAYGVKDHGAGVKTSVSVGVGSTFDAADQDLSARKIQQKSAQGIGPRVAPAAPGVRSVPLSDLDVEPERFQYKLNTNEQGVGRELANVRAYNPDLAGVLTVWRDPADGRLKVVNGHHRFELAQRTGQKTVDVREIQAPDAARARTTGALINIAEGRGTAVDAAKLFRDSQTTPETLAQRGVSLSGPVAKDGLALAKLHPSIFAQVVNGQMSVQRGAIIGASGLAPEQQLALTQMLDQREATGKRMTNEAVGELIRFVQGAGTEDATQDSLFGPEQMTQSLAPEKADLSAYVKDRLAKDRRIFGFVSKGERAGRIEGAGAGTINTERAADLATRAAQAEEIYHKLSTMTGPVSEALTNAAREVARGGDKGAIRQSLYDAISGHVTDALRAVAPGAGQHPPAHAGGAGPSGGGVQATHPQVHAAARRDDAGLRHVDEQQEPLAFVRTSPGRAGMGVNAERLADTMSANVYQGSLPQVVVKEAVQNAIDAMRPHGGGKLTIRLDPSATEGPQVIVQDDGVGMTPEIATGAFLDAFESSKPEGATGGLGIAKAALFRYASPFHVETVADVKRTFGTKRVKTTIDGTGDDWVKGTLRVNEEDVPKDTPTGTRYEVRFAEKAAKSMDFYAANDFARNLAENSHVPGLRFDIEGTYGRIKAEPHEALSKAPAERVNFPGGFADLYIAPSRVQIGGSEVHVLNNGYYQFNQFVRFGGNEAPQFWVDVHPSVGVTDPAYPFTIDRNRLKDTADKAVRDVISALEKKDRQRDIDTLLKGLASAPVIGKDAGRVYVTDGSLQQSGAETIASRDYALAAGRAWNAAGTRMFDAIRKHRPLPAPEFDGIGIGDYLAVNIQRTGIAKRAQELGIDSPEAQANVVLFNPFAIYSEAAKLAAAEAATDPDYLADQTFGALAHEIAHQLERGHGGQFAGVLTRITGASARTHATIIEELSGMWRAVLGDATFTQDLEFVNAARAASRDTLGGFSGHNETGAANAAATGGDRDAGGARGRDRGGRDVGAPAPVRRFGTSAETPDAEALPAGGIGGAQGARARRAEISRRHQQQSGRGAEGEGPAPPTANLGAFNEDLFGNPVDEPSEPSQGSLFSSREGTESARSLAETERAARAELETLHAKLASRALSPMQRLKLTKRAAALERLVNRDRAISQGELGRRIAADDDDSYPMSFMRRGGGQGGSDEGKVRDLGQYRAERKLSREMGDVSPFMDDVLGGFKPENMSGGAAPPGKPSLKLHPMPEPSGLGDRQRAFRPLELVRKVKAILAPETLGPEARGTAGTVRHEAAKRFRAYTQAAHALSGLQKYIDKQPRARQVDLWDRYERGEPTGDQYIDAQNKVFAQATEQRTSELIKLDRLRAERAIDNYIGRFWQTNSDPAKATNFLRSILGRRPVEGPKSFLKQRSLEHFTEGLDAGLTPATYNYVESQLAKIQEMERLIGYEHAIRAETKAGRAKAVMNDYAPPRDVDGDPWVKIDRDGNDPAFTVYGPPRVTHWEGVDNVVFGKLQHLIKALGVEHERPIHMRPGRHGEAEGDRIIRARFGGDEGTVMHELGHILDARYGLKAAIQRGIGEAPKRTVETGKRAGKQVPDYSKEAPEARARRKDLRDELRNLANLRDESVDEHGHTSAPETKDLQAGRRKYLHSWPEKMANIVHAYILIPERMRQVAPGIYGLLDDIIEQHPELHVLRDMKPSLGGEGHVATQELPGPVIAGHIYAPKNSAAIWHNHLSRGLAGNPIYDALTAPGKAATQVLLGFSGFHGTVIGTEGLFSELVMASDKTVRGDVTGASKSLGGGATAPVSGVAFGRKVMREYRQPGTQPELARVIDAMVAGGFRGQHTSELWTGDRTKALKRAVRKAIHGDTTLQKAMGAAAVPIDAVEAGIELAAAPLMSKYVPLMKAAATYQAVAQRLTELPPDVEPERLEREMWDIVHEMDTRFGQVIYDNHFIHRIAKDLAQALFLAPGWTFGTLNLMYRGARDVALIPKRAYERATGNADASTPIVGRSGKYWIAAVTATMLLNGLLTYLNTGDQPGSEDPDGWKDFFAFRDGTYDADGNANRHTIPGYLMHDVYGWSTHPFDTFLNKLSPFFTFATRVIRNRDFSGNMIHDPDADVPTQAKQIGKAALKEFAPLSVQNYLEGKQREPKTGAEMARDAFGVTPAKREFQRDDAQNRMAEILSRTGHDAATPDEAQARADRADALRGMRTGATNVADRVNTAIQRGELTTPQLEQMMRRAGMTSLQERYKSLTVPEALDVFNRSTPREKALFIDILNAKIARASKAGTLPTTVGGFPNPARP